MKYGATVKEPFLRDLALALALPRMAREVQVGAVLVRWLKSQRRKRERR